MLYGSSLMISFVLDLPLLIAFSNLFTCPIIRLKDAKYFLAHFSSIQLFFYNFCQNFHISQIKLFDDYSSNWLKTL